MSSLDKRIAYLEDRVPDSLKHPDDPRDRRVLKDRALRLALQMKRLRGIILFILPFVILYATGYRLVDRKDAELAAMVLRIQPDAHALSDRDLKHRLAGRGAAIDVLESALASPLTATGWLSGLFMVSPAPEAVRRGEIGTKLVDRIAKIDIVEAGPVIDRLLVLAHHSGEKITMEALENIAKLPTATRAALFNNKGDILTRLARISGTFDEASSQLLSAERALSEASNDLDRRRRDRDQQRDSLSQELRRVDASTTHLAAARLALNACTTTVRHQYRLR